MSITYKEIQILHRASNKTYEVIIDTKNKLLNLTKFAKQLGITRDIYDFCRRSDVRALIEEIKFTKKNDKVCYSWLKEVQITGSSRTNERILSGMYVHVDILKMLLKENRKDLKIADLIKSKL